MREKAIKIKRKRCASDWFLDIFKVVFLVLITVISVFLMIFVKSVEKKYLNQSRPTNCEFAISAK